MMCELAYEPLVVFRKACCTGRAGEVSRIFVGLRILAAGGVVGAMQPVAVVVSVISARL